MKKIILLLVLPLTTLMAIDFTMTRDGLIAPSNTEDTATSGTNAYLEPVNLPKCDAGNPEVQFIRSNADWNTINSSSKRIFCVSPGDYRSLRNIKVTASGTVEKRRYIILNNGNDTHPGKLTKNTTNLAMFALEFDGASYWIVDRQSFFDNSSTGNIVQLTNGSEHNVLNRMFTNNVARSVRIINGSHHTTIQNSRFDTMVHSARTADMNAIEMVPYNYGGEQAITHTKIINNEIKNAGDGIQMVSYWYETGTPLNGEGTIIDSNDIYITSDVYTDGNGNYTPSGSYAYAENALDIKFGSTNPANPVIITNNHFWGFRFSDKTNSNLSDHGSAFVAHYGIGNTELRDNVVFDSNNGIGIGAQAGFDYSFAGLVSNNLIYDSGVTGDAPYGLPLSLANAEGATMEDNTIIASRSNYLRAYYNFNNTTVQNNLALDCPNDWYKNNNKSSESTYTHHPLNNNNGSYQVVASVSAGYTNDYLFTTDNFTSNPRIIRLENVLKSN